MSPQIRLTAACALLVALAAPARSQPAPSPAAAIAAQARLLHTQCADLAEALGMAQRPRTRADLDRLRGICHEADHLALDPAPGAARLRGLTARLRAAGATLTRLRAARAARSPEAFALAVESPLAPVFLDAAQFRARFASTYPLAAARGEAEGFQVVAVPTEGPVPEVRWQLSAPRDPGGQTLPASVRLVGHVSCPPAAYPTGHTGWWPDPLLEDVETPPSVPRDEVLPLWVTVTVPPDAHPGVYRGRLTVTARAMPSRSLTLTVRVLDFQLPRPGSLPAVVSLRALPRGTYPAGSVPRVLRQTEDRLLADYRLNPASLYGGTPRWDAARLSQLKALGLGAVCVGYVNAPLGPAFDPAWLTDGLATRLEQSRPFMDTASAASLTERLFMFGFDERPADDLAPIFQAAAQVKARYPGLAFMTTARDPSLGLDHPDGASVDTWAVPLPDSDLRADPIARARLQGRRVWWYLPSSAHPPYPNWFVESGPLEARLIAGAMAARYQPDGILYYAANRWPADASPLTAGPRTPFPPQTSPGYNGDGCLLYPGPNGVLGSIRLEAIRDGLEDFEYYALLRSLLARAKAAPEAARVPDSLVRDLSHFTRDPRALSRERLRLARLILALQRRLDRPTPAARPAPEAPKQGGALRPPGNTTPARPEPGP